MTRLAAHFARLTTAALLALSASVAHAAELQASIDYTTTTEFACTELAQSTRGPISPLKTEDGFVFTLGREDLGVVIVDWSDATGHYDVTMSVYRDTVSGYERVEIVDAKWATTVSPDGVWHGFRGAARTEDNDALLIELAWAKTDNTSIHWHEGTIDWRFEGRRATEDFLARVTYTNEDTVVELLQ